MILKSIGEENQINNILFGSSEIDKVMEKVNILTENINRIKKVNGSKVYDVLIDDKYIYYNLRPFKKPSDREYYYPIQYANIEFI